MVFATSGGASVFPQQILTTLKTTHVKNRSEVILVVGDILRHWPSEKISQEHQFD